MSEAFWRGAVNRRAKNLALMKPFFDLEANKGMQVDLRDYDMHLLCSVLMEAIIAEMGGVAGGAPYPAILRELSKVVLKLHPKAPANEVDRIASHIIDHLSSSRGRDHFEVTYQVIADGGAVETLSHAYRLLEQRLSPDDELVYVATAEAIHIYLSGLGHELEAEQAANDAILEHYLRRGKHREAGEAADMERKRSVELRAQLRGWLIAAERSFDEIQYARIVLPELAEIRGRVEARGSIEQRQIEEIQSRALQLPPGDEGRVTLTNARKAITEASLEHTRLLAELQRCSRMLLDWQSHHRFRRGESPAVPDPLTGFLQPILRLTNTELADAVLRLWPLLLPPRLPVLPDLPALLDSLLADARQPHDLSELEPIPENCEEVVGPKRFTPEVCAAGDALLDSLGDTFSLSTALTAAAEKFGPNSPELDYIAVLVPRWFECEATDDRVARSTGKPINTPGFFGDELAVARGDAV
jgi:hypothetical protein